MQIITKSSIVQWQNTIYIAEAGSKGLGYFFNLYSWEAFEGRMSHRRVESNQRAVEHNLIQLKYQSLLTHPSTKLDKYAVDKEI
jgi:hypothetical protein